MFLIAEDLIHAISLEWYSSVSFSTDFREVHHFRRGDVVHRLSLCGFEDRSGLSPFEVAVEVTAHCSR